VSDDDWFERALQGDEDGTDGDGTTGDGEATPPSAPPDPADGDDGGAAADGPDRDGDGPETADGDAGEAFDAGSAGAADGADADGSLGAPGDGADADGSLGAPGDGADDGTDAGGPAFDEDFASALDRAPSPGGGSDGGGSDPLGGDDPFGGGEGAAFDDIPGADADSFDEESFDSDLDRIAIGIEGLDEMILGGVPRRSLMTAIGSAGTGKTTFGLQFLHHALERDRRAVYITLEESRPRILNTADEKGWEFSRHVEEGRLAVVDLDPVEMANSLTSIRNDLPRLVEAFDASRLVLDSVSLLEMMYDHPATRRSEVFDFTRSLKDAGVSIMFTSEASSEDPYTSRYGLVEYLADAVFVLQYVRPSDFRETRLAIEIQKIRDANHSRETKPYEITSDGISVYQQANIF
jgi:KaiC domain protein